MNASLASLETMPTKVNTNFMKWWELLNAELKALGQFAVTYGPARGYYNCGYCTKTAAEDIKVINQMTDGPYS